MLFSRKTDGNWGQKHGFIVSHVNAKSELNLAEKLLTVPSGRHSFVSALHCSFVCSQSFFCSSNSRVYSSVHPLTPMSALPPSGLPTPTHSRDCLQIFSVVGRGRSSSFSPPCHCRVRHARLSPRSAVCTDRERTRRRSGRRLVTLSPMGVR